MGETVTDPCPKCGTVHEKCKAHTRAGKPCRGTVMQGQQVCRMHGGSSPQCLNAARQRLAAMVDPALGRLRKLIRSKSDATALGAIRDVLDRNGLKAPDVVELGGKDGGPLQVVFVRPEPKP